MRKRPLQVGCGVRPEGARPTTQTGQPGAHGARGTAPQERPTRPGSSRHWVLPVLLLTPTPNLFRTPELVSVKGLQAVHPPEPPGTAVIDGEAPTFHSRSLSPLLSGETTTFGA